jgi:hypothetical protein
MEGLVMSRKRTLEVADESELLIAEAALKAYRQSKAEVSRAPYGHGMEVLEFALMTHGRQSLSVMSQELAKPQSEKKR